MSNDSAAETRKIVPSSSRLAASPASPGPATFPVAKTRSTAVKLSAGSCGNRRKLQKENTALIVIKQPPWNAAEVSTASQKPGATPSSAAKQTNKRR